METSFQIFPEAAEKGHCDAMFHVAYSYEMGEGIERDLDNAIKWYRESANGGNSAAQTNLARMLIDNGGSVDEAFKLLQQASENGQVEAQLYLAGGHYQGWFGKNSNQNIGLELLRKAAKNRSPEALHLLKHLGHSPP